MRRKVALAAVPSEADTLGANDDTGLLQAAAAKGKSKVIVRIVLIGEHR
jgi:hypothetical protein